MAFGNVVKSIAGVYVAVALGGYLVQQWSHDCAVGTYPVAIGPEAVKRDQLYHLQSTVTGKKTTMSWPEHAYLAALYPVRFVQQVVSGDASLRDFVLAKQCKPAETKKLSNAR